MYSETGGECCFLSVLVICLQWSDTGGRRLHGTQCKFSGKYFCSSITRHLMSKIDLPPNACNIHDCSSCIKTTKTFILHKEKNLLSPQSFILRHLETDYDNSSTSYECKNSANIPCECDDNTCGGTPDFCNFRQCTVTTKDCFCSLTHLKPKMLAITEEETISNPDFITFEICLFDERIKRPPQRKLMEGESASFNQHNYTIRFDDPILTLPDKGRVILRNEEFEHVFTVPEDSMIRIPFELLAYKSDITVIYLHTSGITVSGVIHVAGKTICQLRQCFLCWDVLNHFRCFPSALQYTLYIIFIFLILMILTFLKTLIKSVSFVFKTGILILKTIIKAFKFIARISLLTGAFIGTILQQILRNCYEHLENNAQRGTNIVSLPLVIVACSLIMTCVQADCNTHSIINSELRTCDTLQDTTKVCQLHTTSEISLPSISSQSCLWFTDKQDNHLFSLKIKLEAVKCNFHTERQYFTFPVKAKHISQISCIFNEYCGRGKHCLKRYVGQEGTHFEAETKESKDFPGVTSCLPGGLGVGCAMLTRAACNFYRTWYEPDLLHSYEVSKIRGHSCKYEISVQHLENNTISRLTVSDSAYTSNGIRVTVLGAYDQPQLHIEDFFIQRVGRPLEAYLSPASHRNNPKAGQIGAVQANSSFTKNFIFDPEMSTCDYFEDTLRCITAPDALKQLRSSQEHALPLQRDVHLFQIQDDMLQSSLLTSAAVRIQLHFTNFKITVQAKTICPKIEDNDIVVTGCYKCAVLARVSFYASSTCDPGVATVQFQEINVHTKAIHLTTSPQQQFVKFFAETKCYNEKFCLKTQSLIQCRKIKFCLNEPTVELLMLNTNYTKTLDTQSSQSWYDWFHLPTMNSSLFLLKLLGSGLFIICLLITTFSTIITCCCRSR